MPAHKKWPPGVHLQILQKSRKGLSAQSHFARSEGKDDVSPDKLPQVICMFQDQMKNSLSLLLALLLLVAAASGVAFKRRDEARQALTCTQNAGDMLYLPSEWGHTLVNSKETTVAVAIQFDQENLDFVGAY